MADTKIGQASPQAKSKMEADEKGGARSGEQTGKLSQVNRSTMTASLAIGKADELQRAAVPSQREPTRPQPEPDAFATRRESSSAPSYVSLSG